MLEAREESQQKQIEIHKSEPRKQKHQLRRYQSSSMDENEFLDYIENPALRLNFDNIKQRQQIREIQNIDQFKLISYGFDNKKAKYLLKAQAAAIAQEQKGNEDEVVQEELPGYASVSLCCMSSSNPFRNRIIIFVTKNPWFDRFILLIIILNSLFLAMDQEVDVVSQNSPNIDLAFLIIYTIEMILKIIALGFFQETNSYLRDPWNILDFTVVFFGWISNFVKSQGIQSIKILRILRPLKVIRKVPGMPRLVQTIIDSLPVMVDVMLLFLFAIVVFGTIATQVIGGDLKNSCVGIIDDNQVYLLGEKKERFLCQEQQQCDDLTNSGKYEGGPFYCLNIGNPMMDQLSYDNILYSTLNIFESISLIGWADQMYWVRNAHGGTDMDFFYVAQVFIGCFVILVLLINVQAFFLDQAFENEEKMNLEKLQKQKQKNITNKMYEIQINNKIEENEKFQEKIFNELESSIKKRIDLNKQNKKTNILRIKFPQWLVNLSIQADNFCSNNIYFKNSIVGIIVLNTIMMASEFYDQPIWLTNLQQNANYVFTGFFTIEMLIKLFGYGFVKYFSDKFNLFDSFVVLMSFVDIATSGSGSNLAIIKAFRLLRIFKLIKEWDKFKKIVATLADSIKPIINLGILMFLYLFISALLFKQICKGNLVNENGDPSRYGWNNTSQSLVTMFVLLTGDLWTDILHFTVSIEQNVWLSALVVFIFILGHYMLLNLFLAVLLRAISKEEKEAEDEVQKEELDQEEEIKELENLQQQILTNLKKIDNINPEQDTEEAKKLRVKQKFKEIQKLMQIAVKHKNKKSQAVKNIEQKIMQEINQDQQQVLDILQSDIDQEFQIMQDCVFEQCQDIKKGEEFNIDQVFKNNEIDRNIDLLKGQNNQQQNQNQDKMENRYDYSLFIFSNTNLIRVAATKITESHYFDGFINHIIALSCLLIALDQPEQPYQPGQDDAPFWPQQPIIQDIYQKETISLMINLTSYIFLVECALKIISKGFYFGENTYLKDLFNVLDFSIVIFSIVTWILESTFGSKNPYTKGFRSLRALRPLRFVRSNESLKMVINAIFRSMPQLFSVTLIVLLFILVFGILGIQLFKGSLGECSIQSSTIQTKQDCLDYIMTSASSLRFLQDNSIPNDPNLTQSDNSTSSNTELSPEGSTTEATSPSWTVKSVNYDNILYSMLTFFEITTFEGWSQMMFDASDSVGYDQVMVEKSRQWVQIIYIFYIFIMTFFVMNLFISVIVEKFKDEIKEYQGSRFLNNEQVQWIKIQKLMVLANPKRVPVEPVNKIRMKCFKIVQSEAFEYMSILAITFNSIFLCMYHDNQTPFYDNMLNVSNFVLVGYFTLEIVLKIIAYGFKFFWGQVWNKFDAVIVGLSIVGFFETYFQQIGIDITVLKIIRVTRLLRILKINRGLRKLLKTLLMSVRNILNVFVLLILIWFVFSIIGMNIFSKQEFGDAYNQDANFATFYISMLLMIRCSTGGRWNDIMHEMYPDRGLIAIFFWLFFTLIVFFVLMNVFIAVIGKSFADNQENNDINDILSIKKKDLKAFIDTWAKFNPGGEVLMKTTRLVEFLKDLPTPLGYKGICLQKQMINRIIFCLNIKDRSGYIYYPEVMWSIFHALGGYNSDSVLKCKEVESILRDIKKKYKLLSQQIKRVEIWNKKTKMRERIEITEKVKVTMHTLCGNKYFINQMTSFEYIQAMKIFTSFIALKKRQKDQLINQD